MRHVGWAAAVLRWRGRLRKSARPAGRRVRRPAEIAVIRVVCRLLCPTVPQRSCPSQKRWRDHTIWHAILFILTSRQVPSFTRAIEVHPRHRLSLICNHSSSSVKLESSARFRSPTISRMSTISACGGSCSSVATGTTGEVTSASAAAAAPCDRTNGLNRQWARGAEGESPPPHMLTCSRR